MIKPDGTIIELKKDDIFEREIIKANGIKIKAKSFAIAGLEIGSILEYRYRETYDGDSASDERLIFQRDIPIETMSYYVKPYEDSNLRYEQFNIPTNVNFVKDKKGFSVATMNDVKAFKEEPQMPPPDQVRSWMLLYYTPISTSNALVNSMVYWALFTSNYAEGYKNLTKPNNEVKKAAADITQGLSDPEEKLKKLYEFCQTNIKNTSYDASMTDETRKKLKKNNNSGDTLKNKAGSSQDIDFLFASLAKALEFDTALTFTGDRSEFFFKIENARRSFVHPSSIGIKLGNSWKFFNPGTFYLPFGMLVWFEENSTAILVADKGFTTSQTPLSDYSKSLAKRTRKFKLLENGTLDGDVSVEYVGHSAIDRRRQDFEDSQTKRESDYKEEVKNQLSTAEISDIKITNFDEPAKPLGYSYKVHIPNHAQKTGKRLFLQPGFFEYGVKPMFSSETRIHPVYFSYPWSENDEVTIELPKGFSLDNADVPPTVSDPSNIGLLDINIGVSQDKTTLVYKRKFHFGGKGNILFPAAAYQPLKTLFDAFEKADSHIISLKQN